MILKIFLLIEKYVQLLELFEFSLLFVDRIKANSQIT